MVALRVDYLKALSPQPHYGLGKPWIKVIYKNWNLESGRVQKILSVWAKIVKIFISNAKSKNKILFFVANLTIGSCILICENVWKKFQKIWLHRLQEIYIQSRKIMEFGHWSKLVCKTLNPLNLKFFMSNFDLKIFLS